MRRLTTVTLGLASLLWLASSCSTEELTGNQELSSTEKKQLEALAYSTHEATRFSETDPIAGSRNGYVLEGDLKLTEEEVAMQAVLSTQEIEGEQYRVSNTVTGPRTINIIGWTGAGYALPPNVQQALSWAVANYNRENISLYFNLTFGASTTGQSIIVYQINGPGNVHSGYPSGGSPYRYIQVDSGAVNYSLDLLEWHLTHHIGHCIGFAHTNYYVSSPCHPNPSTSSIHIPGTPTSDPGSVWNTCPQNPVTGEFSPYDRIALQYLF